MTTLIPSSVIISLFFLMAIATFSSLLNYWDIHGRDFSALQSLQVERINSSIEISSAGPTSTDLDCTNFTASVVNTGSINFIPVQDGDVLVEYTDTGGSKVVSYLEYATTAVTGNRWTVTSLSPDTRNASQWDIQETALKHEPRAY